MERGEERDGSGKRDRLARLLRVVALLRAYPAGVRIPEIARRIDVSVRTVYRDLTAIERELQIPVWSEGGLWGVEDEAFLPPLRLTQQEAMAVVLSARLMVRYADKYDPDLAAAFEKLAGGLPPALAEHVERTLRVLARAARDDAFNDRVRTLTKAWAERRIVTIDYEPARYGPQSERRRATVALYLIGFDEERSGLRTFKIERIHSVALTPRTFDPPEPGAVTEALRGAWDIIADQEPIDVVLRFVPAVAARVMETTWHPSQRVSLERDGSLTWTATVAGPVEIRLWILSWGDEVEVLAPPELRADVADRLARAAAAYEAPGARA